MDWDKFEQAFCYSYVGSYNVKNEGGGSTSGGEGFMPCERVAELVPYIFETSIEMTGNGDTGPATPGQIEPGATMTLIYARGEMWPRNDDAINTIPRSKKGGKEFIFFTMVNPGVRRKGQHSFANRRRS